MKKLLLISFSAGLLISACSFGGDASNKEEVKFGDLMNKGKHVTFKVDNNEEETYAPDKNNPIDTYIFTENGKVTAYNSDGDTKLEDMKDKSYDEILKTAKKQDKKYFKEQKKDNKVEAEEDYEIDEYNYKESVKNTGKNSSVTKLQKGRFDDSKKAYDKIKNMSYEEPKKRDVKIKVVEDGTGNNTKKEKFYTTADGFDDDLGYIRFIHDTKTLNSNYSYKMKNSGDTVKIYDDKYAYLDNDEDGDDRKYLVTKVGDKAKSSALDKPDSKNVKVEKEDE